MFRCYTQQKNTIFISWISWLTYKYQNQIISVVVCKVRDRWYKYIIEVLTVGEIPILISQVKVWNISKGHRLEPQFEVRRALSSTRGCLITLSISLSWIFMHIMWRHVNSTVRVTDSQIHNYGLCKSKFASKVNYYFTRIYRSILLMNLVIISGHVTAAAWKRTVTVHKVAGVLNDDRRVVKKTCRT